MELIEVAADFINYFDPDPKWPVIVEPFKENGLVKISNYQPVYIINDNVDFSAVFNDPAEKIELSTRAVRIKIQKTNPDLELFSSLGPEKAGFARNIIESTLKDEEYSLEGIDAEVVSTISCNLYRKNKVFLPLIKNLVTLDASEIIEIASPFLVQSKA
jgi:hypothetical protein